MSFIQFESSRVKDAEREALREAREKVLIDAEAAYHRKKYREERAKERGDDTWMLPSVEAKLSSGDGRKKKNKKEKKAKKSKKKRKKRSKSTSDSDSSEDETEEWVEKDDSAKSDAAKPEKLEPEKPLVRDDWMNLSGSFLCSAREKTQKRIDDEKKARDTCIVSEPGQSKNELNPYWKDGGTGLPETEEKKPKLMDAAWLKKSLQRAKEQAREEGRSLEDIATERWGSLNAINSMIEEAEKNSKRTYGSGNDSTHRRDRNWSSTRDHERLRRRDDEKHREIRETDRTTRDDRSNRRHCDRSRSRSSERSRRTNRDRNYDKDHQDHRKKLAFRRPDDDEPSSSTISTPKSVSAAKRWRKPEAKQKKIVEQRADDRRRSKSSPKRSEKFDSDRDDSENDANDETNVAAEETTIDRVMTESELNQLGAKIIKAEIMGDDDLAMILRAKLETARKCRENRPKISMDSNVSGENDAILTTTNAAGMTRPVEPRNAYREPVGGRRKSKKVDTHESGERVRYFADDDKFTLQEMFQREKGANSAENDAAFVRMASKSMDMDELFEQRITREESDAKQDERDRSRAIVDHQKQASIMARCSWCFDSKNMLKHMIVAMGQKFYVSLPPHASLTTGHCILTPVHHVSCQTQLDEDVWEELQNFKKAITKMFMDKDEFPVFFEVFPGQHRYPHMQLECVPLPDEVGSMAPIYFKKALSECEMEWSTNKKVVDLSKKNVREAIPKGLPYFAVNFGNHGGFAHVIEDEKLFPRNFAQEIIGGILDLDHSLWRKPRRENFDKQRKKVLEFAARWKPYDLTTCDDSS